MPDTDESFPIAPFKAWICLQCGSTIGRIEPHSGTLVLDFFGVTFVRMEPDDSGQVFCRACGVPRRWERCAQIEF